MTVCNFVIYSSATIYYVCLCEHSLEVITGEMVTDVFSKSLLGHQDNCSLVERDVIWGYRQIYFLKKIFH